MKAADIAVYRTYPIRTRSGGISKMRMDLVAQREAIL